ncbi:MAG: phytanoyl-CoA dioxygenase family protein [Pseudomonadales bacterium]|nr:phytanoyl-CoA dioxygenase family protein [Pseudomonadales bacterium]
MLSQEEKESFVKWGFVKIDALIPNEVVDPIREAVLGRLRRHGFWGEEGWEAPADAEAEKKLRNTIKEISRSSKSLRPILTERVLSYARDLVSGDEVEMSPPITQFLFTAPRSYVMNHDGRWNGEWEVPRSIWHLDMPRSRSIGPPGPEMFTFLNKVEPKGGGTLILAGSHRLLNDVDYLSSKGVKRKLKRHAYFRELTGKGDGDRSRFLEEIGDIDNVPVKVVELTGDPGDVYFVDLRLLHSLGANTSDQPRMMIAQRMPRQEAFNALMATVGGKGTEVAQGAMGNN